VIFSIALNPLIRNTEKMLFSMFSIITEVAYDVSAQYL